MLHRRMHGLYKDIDRSVVENEANDKVKESERLQELGQAFLEDKAKLEAEYEIIENSAVLSPNHKKELLQNLKDAILLLQEDYERKVTEQQLKGQEELRNKTEILQEAADELDTQIESLQNVRMDVAATDTDAAIEAAKAEKQKFEQMKAQYVEQLNLKIEQQQIQRRDIMRKRFSGR